MVILFCCWKKIPRQVKAVQNSTPQIKGSSQALDDVLTKISSDKERLSKISEIFSGRKRRGIVISLMGYDGSGKTTLCNHLLACFDAASVPAQRLHIYRLHKNILVTPVIILVNRYIWKSVLILDRGIYDNLAHKLANRPRWILRLLVRLIYMFYPAFDHKFYLHSTLEQTILRRDDLVAHRYREMSEAYEFIGAHLGYITLDSNEYLLGNVLDLILSD